MAGRSDARRREILAAAARAVAEHGFHGMSMRDLAKKTRQAPATLYHYVASKEEMLFAIQREAFDELLARARNAVSSNTDANARLRRFVRSHVEFFAQRPYLLRILIQEAGTLPPRRRAEIRAQKAAYFSVAYAVVEALMRAESGAAPDPREVEKRTYCLFGMLNWTYGWYEPARHGDAGELADAIAHTALEGLARSTEAACR